MEISRAEFFYMSKDFPITQPTVSVEAQHSLHKTELFIIKKMRKFESHSVKCIAPRPDFSRRKIVTIKQTMDKTRILPGRLWWRPHLTVTLTRPYPKPDVTLAGLPPKSNGFFRGPFAFRQIF